MYRDFSDASKQRVLGLVSEVENDKLCDLTDWIVGMISKVGLVDLI